MDVANVVLEYLRVLLSTPVIVGVLGIAFLRVFKRQIGGLIDRVARIRLPGGAEVVTSQKEKEKELPPGDPRPRATESEVELPKSIPLTEAQAQQIGELIQSERENAVLWEYRYLNNYLVRITQQVLDWIGNYQGPISLNLVDTYLQPLVPDANERTAILGALQNHHLVTIANQTIQATPKGREYLQWRGPLPSA